MVRVLVWPSTCEAGREVVRSLSGVRDFEVLEASSDGPRIHIADVTKGVHWIGQLQAAVRDYNVDLIYPCHDEVLKAVSGVWPFQKDSFWDKLAWHGYEVTRTCLSKRATYDLLREKVTVPLRDPIDPRVGYWYKPDFGYGGRRSGFASNDDKHIPISPDDSEYVVTEYLPGPEYTIDCFSQDGDLLWCMARTREQIKSGMSTKTVRLPDGGTSFGELMHHWAIAIGSKIHFDGTWYFQVKERADGTPVLLEVAPRIAGGCALARANGVNLPLLGCHAALGRKVQVLDTGRFNTLYKPMRTEFQVPEFHTLWIDVDDTLLRADGTLDEVLVAVIVRRKNQNLPTMLITRDGTRLGGSGNAPSWITALLCSVLQGRIVHVPPDGSKADHVRKYDCLVDDSFKERLEVHQRTGALVLEPQVAKEVL